MKTSTTKFEATSTALSTYNDLVVEMPSTQAVLATANVVRRMHTNYAWNALATAIYRATLCHGAARASLLTKAWADIEQHAKDVAYGYMAGLALTRSTQAQRSAAIMDLHPVALPVGEARTYTAMNTLDQLRNTLLSEPELVETLKRNGASLSVMDELIAIHANTPEYLRKEIRSRIISTKYAAPEQKSRAMVNGQLMVVKTTGFAAIDALEKGGRHYRVRQGAEKAVVQAFKLAFSYANSCEFWQGIEPRQPRDPEQEIYPGQEDEVFSSPLQDYTVGGRTEQLQYESKQEIFQQIALDYEQAYIDATALYEALAAQLSKVGEVTYLWRINEDDAMPFTPITDKQEAFEELVARNDAYTAQRLASQMGIEAKSSDELEAAVMSAFSDEERAQIEKLMRVAL